MLEKILAGREEGAGGGGGGGGGGGYVTVLLEEVGVVEETPGGDTLGAKEERSDKLGVVSRGAEQHSEQLFVRRSPRLGRLFPAAWLPSQGQTTGLGWVGLGCEEAKSSTFLLVPCLLFGMLCPSSPLFSSPPCSWVCNWSIHRRWIYSSTSLDRMRARDRPRTRQLLNGEGIEDNG